jgi:hypothetical protein
MVPPTGKMTLWSVITIATDKSVGEGFRLVEPRSATHLTNDSNTPPPPLKQPCREEIRRSHERHHDAAGAHQSWRHQRRPLDSTTMMMPILQRR